MNRKRGLSPTGAAEQVQRRSRCLTDALPNSDVDLEEHGADGCRETESQLHSLEESGQKTSSAPG